jgi:hypothetical protein
MTAHNEPATSAPAHVLAYAKTHRKALNKARRVYTTRTDHYFEYEGREATDHLDPVAQEIAFNALTTLVPKPTKKELQFALDFFTPIHVTDAANRWGKHIGSDAHKPPLEKRPGMNNGPRKPKAFDAEAITAATTELGLSEKTLAKLLAKLTAPAQAVA